MEAIAYEQFRELEESHWWFIARRRMFAHLLRCFRPVMPKKRLRILDLGCGMGGMLGALSEHGDVFGIDIEHEALSVCHERGFKGVMLGRGESMPFADSSLDLVTAYDTIEHIPDDRAVLRECARVLRPGGRIMISVPAWQWLYSHQDKLVHHQRRYVATQLSERLVEAGLRPLRISYINFFLFPLIAPVVLLFKLWQTLRPPKEDDMTTNASIKLPLVVNRVLEEVFAFERHLIPGCALPFGHSLLAIAEKPAR